MRFIVDAQLPPALARWLTTQGVEAEHVFGVGLAEASDAAIWLRATDRVAVLVSKDENFALRLQMGATGTAVIWIRYGNVRRVELHGRMAEHRGRAWSRRDPNRTFVTLKGRS